MAAVSEQTFHLPEEEEEDICVGDFDDFLGEDEEIDIVDDGSGRDAETNKFDQIIGALEDCLMDQEFEDARERFCRAHCRLFEDTDENKLEYTEVFALYTALVEGAIERRLRASVPGFDMGSFMALLDERKEELMSDVFDLLLSLGDFGTFKEVMLAYKREASQDAEARLTIQCKPMRLYCEEQEDGEERPDLDFGLTISPVGHGRPGVDRF